MASMNRGVQLPPDTTASALLHALLREACANFDDLAEVDMPQSSKAFRTAFADVIPAFEAARIASKERSVIARRIAMEAAAALVYRDEHGKDEKLSDYLAQGAADPLQLETAVGTSKAPLVLEVPCDGEIHSGAALAALIDRLEHERSLTPPAAEALRWSADQALDLRGRRSAHPAQGDPRHDRGLRR